MTSLVFVALISAMGSRLRYTDIGTVRLHRLFPAESVRSRQASRQTLNEDCRVLKGHLKRANAALQQMLSTHKEDTRVGGIHFVGS